MALRPVFALLLLACCLAPAQAQYKWKDSRGQVHASDLPPPREVPDKDILQRPQAVLKRSPAASAALPGGAASTAVASAAAASKPPVDPELEARRKKGEQDALARQKADEARLQAMRTDNCQRARQHLATLENGQRQVRYNDRGEPVVLDDATRNAEADMARRVMASDCR